jgi:hypothetical protein
MYPSLEMLNFDELSGSSEFVGELADADRRGNSSIKATSPIAVRTNPTIVKNSPCLLGLAAVGWDAGCGIVGAFICGFFFLLRFDLLDIRGIGREAITQLSTAQGSCRGKIPPADCLMGKPDTESERHSAKVPLRLGCHKCKEPSTLRLHLNQTSFDWTYPKCGFVHISFLGLDTTIGPLLLEKSRHELLEEKDYPMAVVFAATAFESELSRLFGKWKEIECIMPGKIFDREECGPSPCGFSAKPVLAPKQCFALGRRKILLLRMLPSASALRRWA